ncbi:unnamed protein product [Parnassius mnemosyne]|uniref:Gag-like protein n=1 Tax=Parnassius mnemosyne TaxID=213953 RepID=A0AAV1LVX3_9NEOP
MSGKSVASGTALTKPKLAAKISKGVSPVTSTALRKKVLLQNAASSSKAAEDESKGTVPEANRMPVIEPTNPNASHTHTEESYETASVHKKQENPALTDFDSDDNSSVAQDMETELEILGKCKHARTDDEWSDADSILSDNNKRSSILPPAYKRAETFEIVQNTSKTAEAIRSWLSYEMDEPIKAINQIQLEVHGLVTKAQPKSSTVALTPHPRNCSEDLTHVKELITEVAHELRSVHVAIQKLVDSLNEVKEKSLLNDTMQTSYNTRIESVTTRIQELQDMIRDQQTRPQCHEETINIETEIQRAINPVVEMIKNLREETIETRDCYTTHMAFQGNTGLSTELAIAEIKDKINDIRNHQCASPSQRLKGKDENSAEVTRHTRETAQFSQPRRRTYAETASMPRYAMILESVDPRLSSEDIISQVRKDVDPIALGVRVNKITKLKNQRIVINCDSQQDQQTLKTAIRDTCSKLTVSTPSIKKPQLRLIGVTTDLTDEKLVKAISSQNSKLTSDLTEEQKAVKVLRRTKGRIRELVNVILEATPQLWSKLRDQKLRIGYQIVSCIDQSPLTQCYRCLSFNHKAINCNNKLCCGYCSEEHDTRECTKQNTVPMCRNCKNSQRENTAHPAYSSQCPEWIKWDKIARSSVSYC